MKAGLWDHLAVCVYVSHKFQYRSWWNLAISTGYLINHSHQ
jgi:hypothetical protein